MNKNILLLPVCDGGVTKTYNKANGHLGVDFGWMQKPQCEILAVQDGTVVDNFYSASCGNSIVLQHDYPDGTHRFTGYIHMLKVSNLKKGTKVKQGQTIGLRGNSGKSNGTHLHIYVTEATTKPYNWDTMKQLCTFDPWPLFYKSKKYNYTLASADKYLVNALTFMEDLPSTDDQLQEQLKQQAEEIAKLKQQLEEKNEALEICENIIQNIKNVLGTTK